MYECNIQMPQCSGDVVLEEDHEEELSKTPFRVIDEYYGNAKKGCGIWNHCFRSAHPLACRHFCNRNRAKVAHPRGTPVHPCVRPHAKYYLSEENSVLKLSRKDLSLGVGFLPQNITLCLIEPGILETFMMRVEERKAPMERLEVIKTATGPMLRSESVAEVCAALLAAGSLRS